MTTFPGSPKLLKGALVGVDSSSLSTGIILFQYNPETMTRRLEPQSMGSEGGDRHEVNRLTGAPKETITLAVEIDASDQLEEGNPDATSNGISPILSALELLIYPKSSTVSGNAALEQMGNIEIIPPEAPMILFVWGPNRVVPVRITSFSITEDAYDARLNPIRAKVDLSLQVLNYGDYQSTDRGFSLFAAYHIAKERMAPSQITASTEHLGTSLNL